MSNETEPGDVRVEAEAPAEACAAALPPWVIPLIAAVAQLIGAIRGIRRGALALLAWLALAAADAAAACRAPLVRLRERVAVQPVRVPAPPRPTIEYRVLPAAPPVTCGPGGCPAPARR